MKKLALAALVGLCTLPALAEVTVAEAWVRATVPAQKATGAFMHLKSDADARLVSAASPVAGVVEIHEMLMDLQAQVKEGDAVPLTLTIENKDGSRETLEVKAAARPLNAPMQMKH